MFRERHGRKALLRGTGFLDIIRRWAISNPISSGAAAGSVLRYVWRCGPKSILDGFNPPPDGFKVKPFHDLEWKPLLSCSKFQGGRTSFAQHPR